MGLADCLHVEEFLEGGGGELAILDHVGILSVPLS